MPFKGFSDVVTQSALNTFLKREMTSVVEFSIFENLNDRPVPPPSPFSLPVTPSQFIALSAYFGQLCTKDISCYFKIRLSIGILCSSCNLFSEQTCYPLAGPSVQTLQPGIPDNQHHSAVLLVQGIWNT